MVKKKKTILQKIFRPRVREVLSGPFIFVMIVPIILLDIFIFMYQNTAMRLYGIPLAKRSDYVKFDRRHLKYLNFLEKTYCLYCSYFNGVIAYTREVAARTERYWCPIKYASNRLGGHDWEQFFAEFGSNEEFRERYYTDGNHLPQMLAEIEKQKR